MPIKTGGRAAVIVPDGVLFGSERYKSIRHEIIGEQQTRSVISMPSGAFKTIYWRQVPLLLFFNTKKQVQVERTNALFYDMLADGNATISEACCC
jgi:type I restriction enzyme M protein